MFAVSAQLVELRFELREVFVAFRAWFSDKRIKPLIVDLAIAADRFDCFALTNLGDIVCRFREVLIEASAVLAELGECPFARTE